MWKAIILQYKCVKSMLYTLSLHKVVCQIYLNKGIFIKIKTLKGIPMCQGL